MPAVTGIIETCLHASDLERSIRFYEDLFGFTKLSSDDRFAAFSVSDRNVLLLFRAGGTNDAVVIPGGIIPGHGGAGRLHVAFSIPAVAEAEWRQRLADHGIAIESVVEWPRGGRSLYFRDLDQHLLELITPGCWSIY